MSGSPLDHETAVICCQRLRDGESLESITAGLHRAPDHLARLLADVTTIDPLAGQPKFDGESLR